MDDIIVTAIVSIVSSGASFVMGGVWWVVQTQKKQARQLNIAFNKIRELEKINASYFDEDVAEAHDRGILCEDHCLRPESGRAVDGQ